MDVRSIKLLQINHNIRSRLLKITRNWSAIMLLKIMRNQCKCGNKKSYSCQK